jgi:hypothetical protein
VHRAEGLVIHDHERVPLLLDRVADFAMTTFRLTVAGEA